MSSASLQPHAGSAERIGFIVGYPFHFYVYKTVYEQFGAEAEFIVDLGIHPGKPPPPGLETEIVSLLEKEGVRYRILRYEDYKFPRHLARFFAPYKGLVSLWEQGCIRLPCNAEKKKINLIYGCGKDLTFLRPTRGIYDLIIGYGKHDYELVSQLSPAVMVGNPKFDPWFKKERILKKAGQKKTLLYLPTHGDLSSIERLAHSLTTLSSDWNVIAKLHYYTPREEPVRVRSLTHRRIELHKDDVDLLELLERADVVLSDNSSAIFDAILADKPIVVADFWDAEYLDTTHQDARWYRRGMTAGTTYSDSLEQRIKRDSSVLTIQDAVQLESVINDAFADAVDMRTERARLRKELFAYTDGSSSQRAADAIRTCLSSTTPTKHPILHYAYEAYKVRARQMSYRRETGFRRYIERLENALRHEAQLPSVRVVQLCTEDTPHPESLRSLIDQNYPTTSYAVSILSSENSSQEKGAVASEIDISKAQVHEKHWGSTIAKVLSEATEEYIFFTTHDCFVPLDTLWRLVSVAQRPTITGAGGYVLGEFMHDPSFLRARRLLGVSDLPIGAPLPSVEHSYIEKHPAGDMRCMLYKRASLEGVYLGAPHIVGVGAALRAYASKNGSLVFEPVPVTCRRNISLLRQLHTSWKEGNTQYFYGGKRLARMPSLFPVRTMLFEALRFGLSESLRFWISECIRRYGFIVAHLNRRTRYTDSGDDGWLR